MLWTQLKELLVANDIVRLRRVQIGDRDEFARIAFEQEIWEYFVSRIDTPVGLDAFLEEAIRDTLSGTRAVFAIIDQRSGQIVGSTAYGNLSEKERRLEIGWSWLCAAARGTEINRATKFALLTHAFDVLQCERVEFKTDVLNTRARRGLAAIGAKEEGVLRSFNYMPGGRRRDVVYYSILAAEWPLVRDARFASLTTRI